MADLKLFRLEKESVAEIPARSARLRKHAGLSGGRPNESLPLGAFTSRLITSRSAYNSAQGVSVLVVTLDWYAS